MIAAMPLLGADIAALTAEGVWVCEGNQLVASVSFSSYPETVGFVMAVAALAQEQNHHPDISFSFHNVQIRVFTHETNSLTLRDEAFARAVKALL